MEVPGVGLTYLHDHVENGPIIRPELCFSCFTGGISFFLDSIVDL